MRIPLSGKMGQLLFIFILLPMKCWGIIGENQIIERPKIECGEEGITFSIRTLHPFRGSIYIKGQHDSASCGRIFTEDLNEVTFTVRVGDCGMIRLRQPHGISYKTVFVATFHPYLVTKLDRSYNVHCFYEQAVKIVENFMEVGPIPTDTIEQHQTLFPSCTYTVREGNLDGPIVRTTAIGKTLVHRWECDNPKYGVLVRNCEASDGDHSSVKVIDERGCPVVGELPSIGQLVYDSTLNFAYIAIEAFSFAGRSSQQFRCEIKVCSKRDGECLGMTPPNCPNMPRGGFRPNSIIDTDMVGVTKVLGTFQGSFVGNAVGNSIVSTVNQPLRESAAMMPPTMLVPEPIEQEPWLKEHNSIHEDGDLLSPLPIVKDNSSKIEDAPLEPEIYLRDDPAEILIKSTTPASDVKHYNDDQRMRRLADSVIDIESQSIEVHSLDDEDPVARPLTLLRDEPLPNKKRDDQTCLDQSAVISLMIAFGVTTLSTVVFITYVCIGLFKTQKRHVSGIDGFSARSTASCHSEDPELPIIFTRRLGQSNYVLPVRMP